MGAPILWAPGEIALFLQEKTAMPIKFLILGGYLGFLGGGELRFYFYGREDFFWIREDLKPESLWRLFCLK